MPTYSLYMDNKEKAIKNIQSGFKNRPIIIEKVVIVPSQMERINGMLVPNEKHYDITFSFEDGGTPNSAGHKKKKGWFSR
jgi:hypothetical protein